MYHFTKDREYLTSRLPSLSDVGEDSLNQQKTKVNQQKLSKYSLLDQ
jgi:hypothetical protein